MSRTVATLPEGGRITDYISLGVIAKAFPVTKVHAVLKATGTASIRQRDLPAHVVVYYVIALALYMHSSYREVLRCLRQRRVADRDRPVEAEAHADRPSWPMSAEPARTSRRREKFGNNRNRGAS